MIVMHRFKPLRCLILLVGAATVLRVTTVGAPPEPNGASLRQFLSHPPVITNMVFQEYRSDSESVKRIYQLKFQPNCFLLRRLGAVQDADRVTKPFADDLFVRFEREYWTFSGNNFITYFDGRSITTLPTNSITRTEAALEDYASTILNLGIFNLPISTLRFDEHFHFRATSPLTGALIEGTFRFDDSGVTTGIDLVATKTQAYRSRIDFEYDSPVLPYRLPNVISRFTLGASGPTLANKFRILYVQTNSVPIQQDEFFPSSFLKDVPASNWIYLTNDTKIAFRDGVQYKVKAVDSASQIDRRRDYYYFLAITFSIALTIFVWKLSRIRNNSNPKPQPRAEHA